MRERNESSEMMEGFWNGLVFRALFTLMLFLRSLMPSILSLITRPSFVERKSLFKKQSMVAYSNCSQTFLLENPLG